MKNIRQFILILFFLIIAFPAISKIHNTTFAYWDKPDVNFLYTLPKKIDKDTKILFIIHGNSRNADTYLNAWQELAYERNVILVAPEFTRENYINFNTLMMSKSNGDLLKDETLYLNNSIEYFFNFFKSKYKLHTNTYKIYGHSAGAQFVHRYLLITKDPAIDQAVIANAGWYTVISDNNYPYGIRNIPVEFKGNQLKNFLDYRISLLIGSADLGNTSLNTSDGAMLQGANRYQRAENFFDYLLIYGEQKNLPVRWKYQVVEGGIHSNEKMAPSAFNILFYDIK